MALFGFFSRKENTNGHSVVPDSISDNSPTQYASGSAPDSASAAEPLVSRDVFVSDQRRQTNGSNGVKKTFGISAVYSFIESMEYEMLGFNDAQVLADRSYKAQRINQFVGELKLEIEKNIDAYGPRLLDLENRARNSRQFGLIEEADELESLASGIKQDIAKLNRFLEELDRKEGIYERIALPYENGFLRGVTAVHGTAVSQFSDVRS
jgi:hypothetical protein